MTSIAAASAALPNEAMLGDVRAGLSRDQKELSPKYFYDRRGSQLFEEITTLPEYYLTRAERRLLARTMPALARRVAPATLVELGAGAADKTRLILDAMRDAGSAALYVPVDVSASFLHDAAARLRLAYPGLGVTPVIADFTEPVRFPPAMPRPVLFAFLGSTIGNFDEPSSVALLSRVRDAMRPADRLLLGADLVKDVAVIEAAYNDARGVTAEFNRNVLRVLNRELGADFDPERFEHRAFFDRERSRIEMHLVSAGAQCVRVPGVGSVAFRNGETIRTEISCKYDRATIARLFAAAGLVVDEWLQHDDPSYALAVGAIAP